MAAVHLPAPLPRSGPGRPPAWLAGLRGWVPAHFCDEAARAPTGGSVGLGHLAAPWKAVTGSLCLELMRMTVHGTNELLLSFPRDLVYLKCKLKSIESDLSMSSPETCWLVVQERQVYAALGTGTLRRC